MAGQPLPVELEQLSSSIPTVTLLAYVGVVSAIMLAVNKFLEAWEKIERIRRIRAELSELGIKGETHDELTQQITTTVDEVVEESTQTILAHYPGDSSGRKNELEIAIRQATRRLFGQLERGLKVEFRAEPAANGQGANQEALNTIINLNRTLRFPEVTKKPMLLH